LYALSYRRLPMAAQAGEQCDRDWSDTNGVEHTAQVRSIIWRGWRLGGDTTDGWHAFVQYAEGLPAPVQVNVCSHVSQVLVSATERRSWMPHARLHVRCWPYV